MLLVAGREPFLTEFRGGLLELGDAIGQNVRIELRTADGQLSALPNLAAELVRLKPDVIVASETPAASAAKRATSTIPIVMAPAGDPTNPFSRSFLEQIQLSARAIGAEIQGGAECSPWIPSAALRAVPE